MINYDFKPQFGNSACSGWGSWPVFPHYGLVAMGGQGPFSLDGMYRRVSAIRILNTFLPYGDGPGCSLFSLEFIHIPFEVL